MLMTVCTYISVWMFGTTSKPRWLSGKNHRSGDETWVLSLVGSSVGSLLEEGVATHFSALTWRILMDRGAQQAVVHESQRVGHGLNSHIVYS